MSQYFTLPSFARARKNQEKLRKSNPQNPVLKDEDEKFLEKQMSQDKPSQSGGECGVTKITDEGEQKPATAEEQKAAAEGDQIVPETQPKSPESPASPSKKKRDVELPSQEEAEAVTRSWNSAVKLDDEKAADKRTWASYLPTTIRPSSSKTDDAAERPDSADQRTWKEYAASYVPTKESIPAWLDPSTWKPKDKDARLEPVLNEDGSVDEEKTKEKQEKEVSVLLDNLNMSTVNNRVFAFSEETQKYYDRFAQCLKDTMNGVPTAYDDMDKLMREAGPTLEKQFKSMPPFVQTLVKSLPAKLSTALAPELLAAASEKPGADAKAKLAEASKSASGAGTSTPKAGEKSKRKIPGLKKLVSQQGVVATMLRNTVNFLTTRFPFLASATNVVMSLAVFILMFVFWYCHKRGRETRLAKEAEASASTAAADDDEDNEVSGSDDEEDDDETEKKLQQTLNQPSPAEVPLPCTEADLLQDPK